MSVNFYFVRHGQSEANLKNEFYNDEESELTNLGRMQAAEVGYELNRLAVDFDIIFCSPFKRARETCKIALDKANLVNVPVVIDERIAERRFDGLVGKTATREHNNLLYHYDSNQAELDGVETLYALENRARGFIDSVIKKYPNMSSSSRTRTLYKRMNTI